MFYALVLYSIKYRCVARTFYEIARESHAHRDNIYGGSMICNNDKYLKELECDAIFQENVPKKKIKRRVNDRKTKISKEINTRLKRKLSV